MLQLRIQHKMLNYLYSFFLRYFVNLLQKQRQRFYAKQAHDGLSVVLDAVDEDSLEFGIIFGKGKLIQELTWFEVWHRLS